MSVRHPITGKLRNPYPKPQGWRGVEGRVMPTANHEHDSNGDEPVRIETGYRLFGSLGDGNRWVRSRGIGSE